MFDQPVQRGIQRIAEEWIQAAWQRGAFSNLPGKGEPLADADVMPDDLWWIRKWIPREGVQPPAGQRELNEALRDMRARRDAQRSSADESREA
mgnify:CR=1 FL=1